MLGWIVLAGAVSFMYKAAELQKRNGFLWAIFTFFLCLLSSRYVPYPFLGLLLGFFVSFCAMLVLKIMEPKQQSNLIRTKEKSKKS